MSNAQEILPYVSRMKPLPDASASLVPSENPQHDRPIQTNIINFTFKKGNFVIFLNFIYYVHYHSFYLYILY